MIYATVLAQAMLDADTANGPKPTARNTPFRYSGAHGCSRQLAYSALKAKPSEPWDIASAYVTGLGTILHESWQSAMAVAYPDAEFEVGSQVNDLLSGSCDAVIADAVVEVKTRGAYAFEKETGIGRYKRTEGSGPSLSAITQVGMNVIGLQRDRPSLSEVCLVTLPREAISVQRAKKLGLSDEERIAAEWWYDFEDVEMYARDEIVRVDEIAEQLQDGWLPEAAAPDDNGDNRKMLGYDDWRCHYCPYRSVCIRDRQQVLSIEASVYTPEDSK